jgi:nitrogen fixation NifU-like protein
MTTGKNRAYGPFSAQVLDHFENPRYGGSFDRDDPSTGTATVGAPTTGGVIKLQIRVDGQGVIEAVKFKAYGDPYTIASGSWLTGRIKGATLEEAATIHNRQIAEELALPPLKIQCAVLAEQALKAAIQNYTIEQSRGRVDKRSAFTN